MLIKTTLKPSKDTKDQGDASAFQICCGLSILGLGTLLLCSGFTEFSQLAWADSVHSVFSVNAEFDAAIALVAASLGALLILWWFCGLALALLVGLRSRLLAESACSPSRVRAHRPTRAAANYPRFFTALATLLISAYLNISTASQGLAAQSAEPPQQPASAPIDPRWQPEPLPEPPESAISPLPAPKPQTRRPVEPGLLIAPAPRQALSGQDRFQTVRPGECLWQLVKRVLGPRATDLEIAEEWPRWYQANRELIGPDPDFVLAGQLLMAPERN
ncbi:LysM peptidoglycan-binding domain-containing protein [Psychromicrobium sp. YIM B11713]|uniref:LysM peptidoglycan-binding domain-containing protein n=1 Tax=Psychromicrobium sp. YIM B11713 TaxID=3145233 RepID=UPI00374FBADB